MHEPEQLQHVLQLLRLMGTTASPEPVLYGYNTGSGDAIQLTLLCLYAVVLMLRSCWCMGCCLLPISPALAEWLDWTNAAYLGGLDLRTCYSPPVYVAGLGYRVLSTRDCLSAVWSLGAWGCGSSRIRALPVLREHG